MSFKKWLLEAVQSLEWALQGKVPQEPGQTSIPSGYVRLFHYTKSGSDDSSKHQVAESLRQNGLDINMAKGSTYGEPNVVWASAAEPDNKKVFAEFAISPKDSRWSRGFAPEGDVEEWQQRRFDVYFNGSITPKEILAVHEPWHFKYRYLKEDSELVSKVISGEFDYLFNKQEYAPAIYRVKKERMI